MQSNILIGTRGWGDDVQPDEPGNSDFGRDASVGDVWSGDFYPENLPMDWRFCFYSNNLRAVLVPAEIWPQVLPQTISQWLEDCDAEFRFVLELPLALSQSMAIAESEAGLTTFLSLIAPLRMVTAALFLRITPTEDINFEWLRSLCEVLSEYKPLCIDLPRPWQGQAITALLHQYDVSLCWHADVAPLPQESGQFLLTLSQQRDPRALQRILAQLAQWQGTHTTGASALFFDAAFNVPQCAQQARVLAELMGV